MNAETLRSSFIKSFYFLPTKSMVISKVHWTYLVRNAIPAPRPATVTKAINAFLIFDSGSGTWKNSTKPSWMGKKKVGESTPVYSHVISKQKIAHNQEMQAHHFTMCQYKEVSFGHCDYVCRHTLDCTNKARQRNQVCPMHYPPHLIWKRKYLMTSFHEYLTLLNVRYLPKLYFSAASLFCPKEDMRKSLAQRDSHSGLDPSHSDACTPLPRKPADWQFAPSSWCHHWRAPLQLSLSHACRLLCLRNSTYWKNLSDNNTNNSNIVPPCKYQMRVKSEENKLSYATGQLHSSLQFHFVQTDILCMCACAKHTNLKQIKKNKRL